MFGEVLNLSNKICAIMISDNIADIGNIAISVVQYVVLLSQIYLIKWSSQYINPVLSYDHLESDPD